MSVHTARTVADARLYERYFARTLQPRRALVRWHSGVFACDGYGLPLHVLHRKIQGRAVHVVTHRPPRPGGLHRALLILYASLPMGLQ